MQRLLLYCTRAPNIACFCIGVQVFGWDMDGTVIFNDVLCKDNTATINGGCFQGSGRAIFNSGASLLGNKAINGACICEHVQFVPIVFRWWQHRSYRRYFFHRGISGDENRAGKRDDSKMRVNPDQQAVCSQRSYRQALHIARVLTFLSVLVRRWAARYVEIC